MLYIVITWAGLSCWIAALALFSILSPCWAWGVLIAGVWATVSLTILGCFLIAIGIYGYQNERD